MEERIKSLEMQLILNNKRILKLEGYSEEEIETIYRQSLINLRDSGTINTDK